MPQNRRPNPRNPITYRIILFDFDGTLADSAQCSILATQAAFAAQHLPAPDAAAIVHSMGIPIETAFRSLGAAALSDAAYAALLADFRRYYSDYTADHVRLFPGISALLATLKAQHKTLAIVSSKRNARLRDNSTRLGIDGYIDVCIGSDQVTHYKPHPDSVHVALAALGYHGAPEAVITVGDATGDIRMGQAAGIRTCAVTWGAHDAAALRAVAPDYLADNVAALQHILLAGGTAR